MWCNHPFSQRNKATKRAVKIEVRRGCGAGWESWLGEGSEGSGGTLVDQT